MGIIKEIYRTQGITPILRSVLPSLLVNSFVGTLVFSLYGISIEYQESMGADVGTNNLSHFYAGAVAGISLPILTTPVQVLLSVSKQQKLFFAPSINYVFQHHGLSFLYRGTVLSFFRDSVGFSLFFGFFASIKYYLGKYAIGIPYEEGVHVVLAGG
eukprot:TRINITY_DN2532_c0_g1_i2.p1 TRINITY_DN2532_c0_g1~~TRINITY_DN2532_c0_g1_i2.p1  ORF type:complete len:157 (+),score=21.38 TRINITY_DN2532_c0_g1_i2:459-929(+)